MNLALLQATGVLQLQQEPRISDVADVLSWLESAVLHRMLADVEEHSLTGRAITEALARRGDHALIPEDQAEAHARLRR